MSDDLTPEELALLAGDEPAAAPAEPVAEETPAPAPEEEPAPAPVEEPAAETPAVEPEASPEEPKKKRGKAARADTTDAEDAQDTTEVVIEPAYFGDHATPAQWGGDPWGDTPVQMRG